MLSERETEAKMQTGLEMLKMCMQFHPQASFGCINPDIVVLTQH